ncbi:MAG TPA: PadR family transcriptional regulator [Solirubrobacter sp.]|nr:PadR family transcriptional regulator [Solirubrobacter sp.]
MPRLTPFSHVVLTLIGRGGAGAHDLVRMMRQGRLYWAGSPSHYYAEPRRLEQLGLLTSRVEPGRTGQRTHYELTDAGLAELREWLATPTAFPRIQSEPIVRALAADLADADTVLQGFDALEAELDDVEAELEALEQQAGSLPDRRAILMINHRLGRRIVAAHREWLAEVRQELTQRRGR